MLQRVRVTGGKVQGWWWEWRGCSERLRKIPIEGGCELALTEYLVWVGWERAFQPWRNCGRWKEAFQFPRLIRTCATKERSCWVQSYSGPWNRAGYPRTSEGNEKEKELKLPGSWEMTEEGWPVTNQHRKPGVRCLLQQEEQASPFLKKGYNGREELSLGVDCWSCNHANSPVECEVTGGPPSKIIL